ncbi:MAG: LPXTG cell wall anchor domain-containing protein [Nanoarchaeota archaeon]
MVKKGKGLFTFLYILFALYFLNAPFQFVKIPESMSVVNSWIIFIGGILLVIGGFSFFKKRRFQ